MSIDGAAPVQRKSMSARQATYSVLSLAGVQLHKNVLYFCFVDDEVEGKIKMRH